MKLQSLFRLGGIAVLLSTILSGVLNLMYFSSGEQPWTIQMYWIDIFGTVLLVLGLVALFARQSQRSGILGLVGFVLLVWANMFFVGSEAISIGVTAGVIAEDQLLEVPSLALASSVLPWIWTAGLIVFGLSVYRAQVLPKYAGALLILQALVQQLTGSLAFTRPIFAVCAFVAWAWLGWSLVKDMRVASWEATTA